MHFSQGKNTVTGELLWLRGSLWQFCLFVFGQHDWCTFCCLPKEKSAFLANFHHRAAFVSIINILAGSTGQSSDNTVLFNSLEITSCFLKTFEVTRYPRNVDFYAGAFLNLRKTSFQIRHKWQTAKSQNVAVSTQFLDCKPTKYFNVRMTAINPALPPASTNSDKFICFGIGFISVCFWLLFDNRVDHSPFWLLRPET